MNNGNLPHLCRRSFIAAAGLGATVAFVPRFLFAQKEGIVPTMIDGAAKAKIETHPLGRRISVLEGFGGNIAVLTGKDGKLLIDSGFTVSKGRLVEALQPTERRPITQLINTHWHIDHTDGNDWVHVAGRQSQHTRTPRSISPPRLVSKDGSIRFLQHQQEPFRPPYLMTNTVCITTIRI